MKFTGYYAAKYTKNQIEELERNKSRLQLRAVICMGSASVSLGLLVVGSRSSSIVFTAMFFLFITLMTLMYPIQWLQYHSQVTKAKKLLKEPPVLTIFENGSIQY